MGVGNAVSNCFTSCVPYPVEVRSPSKPSPPQARQPHAVMKQQARDAEHDALLGEAHALAGRGATCVPRRQTADASSAVMNEKLWSAEHDDSLNNAHTLSEQGAACVRRGQTAEAVFYY